MTNLIRYIVTKPQSAVVLFSFPYLVEYKIPTFALSDIDFKMPSFVFNGTGNNVEFEQHKTPVNLGSAFHIKLWESSNKSHITEITLPLMSENNKQSIINYLAYGMTKEIQLANREIPIALLHKLSQTLCDSLFDIITTFRTNVDEKKATIDSIYNFYETATQTEHPPF